MYKIIMLFLLFYLQDGWSNPYLFKHHSSELFLKIEVLKTRGLHFELTKNPKASRIETSPMVQDNPSLATNTKLEGDEIKSADFQIKVDRDSLCVSVKDVHQQWDLLTTCPHNMADNWKVLNFHTQDAQNAYGLGAYYQNPGTADGDWIGRVWDPLSYTMGNFLRGFSGGANSYAMFPVLYVQGTGIKNYLIFYDNTYKQMWSLGTKPWRVESLGEDLRWYVFSDQNVMKLRQKFMDLTGRPPVPPKAAFGMWLSEFGFENWNEIHGEINSMHQNQMPVDGVALDIQWFGGTFYMGNVDRSGSRFGSLEFDEQNFPEPKSSLSHLKNKRGVEIMAIEESYVSKSRREFRSLDEKRFLAWDCRNKTSSILTKNPWWGIGGMIDWTNPEAGLFWHNQKRQKLYNLGINYHWTDLGEPEMFDENSCYFGLNGKQTHQDIHNIFNFKWIESIARGYEVNKNNQRPFILSRSGTVGIQKFGAAIWSGDIGANMGAMTAHYQTQMHMSYSGIDYFGADIGGFHRRSDTLDGNPDELYTQWFANAALFDFPVRAHTWNLGNNLETAPSKIGHLSSNRFNLKLRYALSPYYYSLAHYAYRDGTPLVYPLSMEFHEDLNVRKMGNQKMIGPFLMAAMVARYGERERNVYLPKGSWIDFHTGKNYESIGKVVSSVSAFENDIFRIPLFVRKGAILPLMKDMPDRSNIRGLMFDGTINNDLVVRVYPSTSKTCFTLHEDDGVTVDYKKGKVAKTSLCQRALGQEVEVIIGSAIGTYKGLKEERNYELEVYLPSGAKSAYLNNSQIKMNFENNFIKIDLGKQKSKAQKKVTIKL